MSLLYTFLGIPRTPEEFGREVKWRGIEEVEVKVRIKYVKSGFFRRKDSYANYVELRAGDNHYEMKLRLKKHKLTKVDWEENGIRCGGCEAFKEAVEAGKILKKYGLNTKINSIPLDELLVELTGRG